MARARETAAICAAPHGLAVRLDLELVEFDWGVWTGLPLEDEMERSVAELRAKWRSGDVDAAPPRGDAVRAVLATQAYRAVGRSLGELDVVRTADEARLVGHLGPDLLGPDWDLGRAVANLLDTDAPLAAALLDQTRVAGLGTMWTAEALFLEGLDPFAPAAERDAAVLAALLGRARRLLRASCSSAVPTSTGSTRPGHETYVHGRRHKPCRRCGTPVQSDRSGARISFWCASCQR